MEADRPKILLVGSINIDFVVKAPHIPVPGETILGSDFEKDPGGKGLNQGAQIARLGAECIFLGRVGDDEFADGLIDGMKKEGIDCTHVIKTKSTPTGVAMIFVDEKGMNSIVVAPGANFKLSPDDIRSRPELFENADLVVMQMEIPLDTVQAAIEMSEKHNCKVIIDPAPAPAVFPPSLFKVDYFSPNETEAEILTKFKRQGDNADEKIAQHILECGAKVVVLKLGERGSMICRSTEDGKREVQIVPAFKISVVDTTAAGDAFTGALAVALGEGQKIEDAVRFANAAGGLACSRFGAMAAMPRRSEVETMLRKGLSSEVENGYLVGEWKKS